MVTLSDINKAFNLDPDNIKQVTANYGKVISINPDKTYQVSLNGSDTTVKCARLTGAKVGDVVLVTTLKNGYSVVTGCVGGDTDAADAQATADSTAQYFWTDTDGAHVTEIPKDDFISTPSGGNLLLHSNSIKIRRALAVLAELDTDGMTVYNGSGTQLAKFGSRIILGSPTAAHLEIFNNGITGCEISQYRRNAQGDIVSAPNSILMGYEGEIQIAYTKSSPHQMLVLNSSGVTVGNLRANTETVPIASSDFTTTTGSISSVSMYRFGNVIQLVMQVTKSSATDAGNNVYSGVLKLADYRPKAQIECGSYSGSVAIIGSLETDGTITARVTGAQLPAGRSPVLTFTYLI